MTAIRMLEIVGSPQQADELIRCLKASGLSIGYTATTATEKVEVYFNAVDVDAAQAGQAIENALTACDPSWQATLKLLPVSDSP